MPRSRRRTDAAVVVIAETPATYIEELPHDRRIAPVATAITAFVGRTRSGPVDEASTIATAAAVYRAALDYCVERRAMLLVDPPGAHESHRPGAPAGPRPRCRRRPQRSVLLPTDAGDRPDERR